MLVVRALRPDDWPVVAAIFTEGIATGDATFETAVPGWEEWDAAHLPAHRLVAERARGRGVGRTLLEALVESARSGGLWTLQAGIFPENEASLALHRALGFREVGVRERIGRLDGTWRDVVLLELRL